MQSDLVLARRYARALFEATASPREQAALREALADAWRTLSPGAAVLRNPAAGAAQNKAVLRRILSGGAPPAVLRFLDLLMDKKRFGLLPPIISEYGRILDERQGVVRAQARSAVELGPDDIQALGKRLEAFSGKKVILDVRLDPELLGGVSVRLGDWVLDGSLRGRLRRMGAQLAQL